MKKILVLHNNYQIRGGEDIAVKNEIQLLREKFEVEEIYFNNFIENYFTQFFYFLINKNYKSIKIVKNKLETFNPDIVYIHNTWFKISTGIFKMLSKKDVKVFIKLHNFRYKCTNTYLRKKHFEKKFCQSCGLNSYEAKFFNKYFKDSYIKSILAIRFGKKLNKVIANKNFNILVLTNFHKNYLIENKISSNVTVFPNFLNEKDSYNEKKEDYIVYAGRISDEKGVLELIENFLIVNFRNIKLKIIGEGPGLKDLKNQFKNDKVVFLGPLSNEETKQQIKSSRGVVTATKLYEGQPTLLCEASMLGVCSVFPNTGGISEFFPKDYTLSFKQYDYKDLQKKLKLLVNTSESKEIGVENNKYISEFLNSKKLISIFEKLVNE